ncbi:hypothetical protein [Chroococcidiopsis thermalis]|uniref:hypothetical protein n=1 Tax=Chroococcidiopsis thermalis TaxID=54299 RepID=UPI0015F0F395|nr:hypothetical protein [Chroococcidiopsis thermalis]
MAIAKLRKMAKAAIAVLAAACLSLGLVSCGSSDTLRAATPPNARSPVQLAGNITEVAPPEAILQLRQALEFRQPQVKILSPQPDEVLQDDTVSARFQVQDLPIFQNSDLGLGPHLHVILDNQPYEAVYDVQKPFVLSNLSPGTHTLRVFASRPWHESFKNEGAYAQTTFHVFTKTDDNNPNSSQPLLTYSRPKGSYGAEPILLDFYLTNAPLHLAAQADPQDEVPDWRIRCTINGKSFIIDRWEPIYLSGFNKGKNWVQLEFLDEQGNPVKNVFNNTVRVISYDPNSQDTLSKLVRGELSAAAARGIVDPDYKGEVEAAPAPLPPAIEETTPPQPEEEIPTETKEKPAETKIETPETETKEPTPIPPAKVEEPKGFFNRFRRPSAATPSPTVPEVKESPAPELTPPAVEPQPEISPEVESAVEPEEKPEAAPKKLEEEQPKGFFNRFRRSPVVAPSPTPEVEAPAPELTTPEATEPLPEIAPEVPAVEITPPVAPTPATPDSPVRAHSSAPLPTPDSQRFGGYFNRFRRPPTATPSPTLPEVEESPTSELNTLEEETTTQETAPELTTPVEPKPIAPETPKTQNPIGQKFGGYFNRFRRPQVTPSPNVTPALPEITEPSEQPIPDTKNSGDAELVPSVGVPESMGDRN